MSNYLQSTWRGLRKHLPGPVVIVQVRGKRMKHQLWIAVNLSVVEDLVMSWVNLGSSCMWLAMNVADLVPGWGLRRIMEKAELSVHRSTSFQVPLGQLADSLVERLSGLRGMFVAMRSCGSYCLVDIADAESQTYVRVDVI